MTKLLDILKNPVCFRLIFCLFIYFCIMYHKIAIIIFVALSCSCAGNSGDEQQKSAFFDKKETTDDVQNEHFDLDKIQESGELIVASLYGPYDYFSFRGMEFGYQFEMAALYANSIGARIRVQVADTMPELKKMLENGEADMIISHSSGGKRDSGVEDATIVATHMILAAADEGVDSCWINFFDPDKMAEAIDLPENEEILMLLNLGYAAEGAGPLPNHSSRKPLAETVSYL